MTNQEKREDKKQRIIAQLRQKVRPHRPAPKVLEMSIALTEDQIEIVAEQKAELEWQLEYIKTLDPKELEPEQKS